MHGEGKYVLRQIQELLCLREFIATDSYKAIFLEESLDKVTFVTSKNATAA